jgi:hypothetical protein
MLSADTLAAFAALDTARQVAVLVNHQVLDTPAGDAVMGHLAGNHPARFTALLDALHREGHAGVTAQPRLNLRGAA